MTETSQDPAPETCRSVKRGGTDLLCSLERGHDEPTEERPATWHRAVFLNRSEIDYPGGHHEIKLVETVTWKPVDHAAEAARHLMAGRDAAERGEMRARANTARRAEAAGLERGTVEDALADDGAAGS